MIEKIIMLITKGQEISILLLFGIVGSVARFFDDSKGTVKEKIKRVFLNFILVITISPYVGSYLAGFVSSEHEHYAYVAVGASFVYSGDFLREYMKNFLLRKK